MLEQVVLDVRPLPNKMDDLMALTWHGFGGTTVRHYGVHRDVCSAEGTPDDFL